MANVYFIWGNIFHWPAGQPARDEKVIFECILDKNLPKDFYPVFLLTKSLAHRKEDTLSVMMDGEDGGHFHWVLDDWLVG